MKIKVNKKELAMIVDALASVNGMSYETEEQRATFYNLFGRLGANLDTPKKISFGPDCYAERIGGGWRAIYKGEILGNTEDPRTFEIAKENCLTAMLPYDEWQSDIDDMHEVSEAEAGRVCQECNPDLVWGTCASCGRDYTP